MATDVAIDPAGDVGPRRTGPLAILRRLRIHYGRNPPGAAARITVIMAAAPVKRPRMGLVQPYP